MTFLLSMHARLLFTMLLVFGGLLVWALVLRVRHAEVGRLFHAGLSIGQLLLLAECVIGVLLLLYGRRPARAMHIVYGVIALATIPLTTAYLRQRNANTRALAYAFACLFICAIALRALATAI